MQFQSDPEIVRKINSLFQFMGVEKHDDAILLGLEKASWPVQNSHDHQGWLLVGTSIIKLNSFPDLFPGW
jgi:hypothetical protein